MRKGVLLGGFLALVVAAGCARGPTPTTGAAPASPTGPVEVKVTLTEFKIEASLTSFKVGVPYRFVVTNAGKVPHELMIMPPVTGEMKGMSMEELDKMALAMIKEEDLPAGATKTLDFTFTTLPTGSLEFACHVPGHYEAGMRLPITVQG